MTPDSVSNFLTAYIASLCEETSSGKKGPRYGFDRIIHELALAEDLVPTRLSFYRQNEGELSQPKKESEHGVDQAFLSRDGKRLFVFVLKDEVLSYRNWIDERFDEDLRRARDQDLTMPELTAVNEVTVILAYNKDDSEEGVESFDKFVAASDTKIAGKATLRFERWNLTTITEKVKERLLTPSLLPENFFHAFTYLCWQVADFTHNSPHWREILIPDWKEFLASVLKPPLTERNVRLVTVALIVLRSHAGRTKPDEQKPGLETGWLDLVEWAVLALFDAARSTPDENVRRAIFEIWYHFYLAELERYYEANIELLATEHSLEIGSGGILQEAAASYLCSWHMGRLGLLVLSFEELSRGIQDQPEEIAKIHSLLVKVTGWMLQLANANPSFLRPFLDIQHIEIFLFWRALALAGVWEDILTWIHQLFERLLFRRIGKSSSSVIACGISWERLFDFLATEQEPHPGFGESSYLILMILEICLGAPNKIGEGLLNVIYKQLIMGENPGEPNFVFKKKLDLIGWGTPATWQERILHEPVLDGVSLTTHFSAGEDELSLPNTLRKFIENSRKAYPLTLSPGYTMSTLVLACIKNASPLPSEFWRGPLFGPVEKEPFEPAVDANS